MSPDDEFDAVEEEVHRVLIEKALLRIREGGHPLLRDLAEAVLKGEMTLEDVAKSSAARPALEAATTRYLEWQKGLTAEENDALVAEMSGRIELMRREVGARMEGGRA